MAELSENSHRGQVFFEWNEVAVDGEGASRVVASRSHGAEREPPDRHATTTLAVPAGRTIRTVY